MAESDVLHYTRKLESKWFRLDFSLSSFTNWTMNLLVRRIYQFGGKEDGYGCKSNMTDVNVGAAEPLTKGLVWNNFTWAGTQKHYYCWPDNVVVCVWKMKGFSNQTISSFFKMRCRQQLKTDTVTPKATKAKYSCKNGKNLTYYFS